MYRIIILEDDAAAKDALIEALSDHPRFHDFYVAFAQSPAELKTQIEADGFPDILFADIVMPEGDMAGIDAVAKLLPAGCGTQVIYVSGYLDKALEVYRTEHTYFLLKPVSQDKLYEATTKALKRIDASTPQILTLKIEQKEVLINVPSITYCESNLRKVTVHAGRDQWTAYAKLDDIQTQLTSTFVRIHRSYLVNMAHIRSLKENTVTLQDGTTLPVSERKAKEAQRALLRFMKGGR